MDVLVSHVPLVDVEAFPACNLLEDALQRLFDKKISQYLATVLGTPHNVVLAVPGAMRTLVQSSVCHTCCNHVMLIIPTIVRGIRELRMQTTAPADAGGSVME